MKNSTAFYKDGIQKSLKFSFSYFQNVKDDEKIRILRIWNLKQSEETL